MQVEDEYYNDPEFLELLEEYEQAEQTGMPVFMDAEDLADIAGYYQSAGRPDDAQKAIEKALEQDPESETALIYKVHEALDAEVPDVQLAQDYLDRIYNKDLPEYVYCQAEIFIVQDKPDEADKYLRNFNSPVDIEGVTGPQHGSFMRLTKKEYKRLKKLVNNQ